MKAILNKYNSVFKILGPQKETDEPIRRSHFVVEERIDGQLVILHTLLKEMFALTQEEEEDYYALNRASETGRYLWEHYFFVPDSFQEIKLLNEVRNILTVSRRLPAHLNHFTILTTTDCNARCFYCYEAGCEKMNMTPEIAQDTVAYILRKIDPSKSVRLSWFGGEPLFNDAAITIICQGLRDAGITYESSMISNAYLFDEAMLEKSVLWNLKSIQITLDGTEEVYNRRKAYIYRDGSAFQKVLRNIELLDDHNIAVSIRLNVDDKNAADLITLTEVLSDRLKGRKRISLYPRLLYDETRHGNPAAYEALEKLEAELDKRGFPPHAGLKTSLHVVRCMVDSGFSTVILPNGHLNSCEHFNEVLPDWGDIYHDDAYDQEILRKYLIRKPFTEICKDCAYAPDCLRLEACPAALDDCNPYEKNRHLSDLKRGMKAAYNNFSKVQN